MNLLGFPDRIAWVIASQPSLALRGDSLAGSPAGGCAPFFKGATK